MSCRCYAGHTTVYIIFLFFFLKEQIAKERQVTGRVQIQVWYENDRKELVVSVLAADEICLRDPDTGSPPQAFAKLVLTPPWSVNYKKKKILNKTKSMEF